MSKILLVEDDQLIIEIYQKKFKAFGFEVINAKTGNQALTLMKSDKFDLVLLDLVLPETSGMDVLKEVRENDEYDKNIKIIAFSNQSEIETQQKALKNGADGFISKTQYNPAELAVEIQRLINQYKEQERNKHRLESDLKKDTEKKKVLLIEDEDIFLDMFGKKLEDDGYVVTRTKNGAWGAKEAMEGDYDLIITDLVMPAMNGEEIIAKLKMEEKTKNIPIIAISASVTNEGEMAVRALGVNEFFLKTHIVPSDLSRKVRELLK